MKNLVVDPILHAALGDIFADLEADAADPLQKFLEASQIAGSRGADGFAMAEALQASTSDGVFASRFERFEKKPTTPHAEDQDAEILTDAALLEKSAMDSRSRRLLNLRKWMRVQLAVGETVETLEQHARQHDAETADLILEAAAGL